MCSSLDWSSLKTNARNNSLNSSRSKPFNSIGRSIYSLTVSAIAGNRVVTIIMLLFSCDFLNGSNSLFHSSSLPHCHISSSISKNLLDFNLCPISSPEVPTFSSLTSGISFTISSVSLSTLKLTETHIQILT
uniref:Uncharacterized protein n=1 Tax=Arundo donax TaxID=35708 RepID=A0A0A9H8V6_ARUDO